MARVLTEISSPEFESLKEVFEQFAIDGTPRTAHRLFQGHLHATYIVEWRDAMGTSRYLHQQINTTAFSRTEDMLHNTAIVSQFLQNHAGNSFPASLFVVPTKGGQPFLHKDGEYWRTYLFVEDSVSYDSCDKESQVVALGRAVGEFLFLMKDLSVEKLKEHSPRFQDTVWRWENLENAIGGGLSERKEAAVQLRTEMEPLRKTAEALQRSLQEGVLITQLIHGDTKVNNFLFRKDSDEVLCLVDIDLCMNASPLFDIGDLMRSACAVGREDEPNLNQVGIKAKYVTAVIQGFLSSRYILSSEERRLLPLAGFVVSFNLATRFLTDYLNGDEYFPVSRPQHNLERAKAQWKVTRLLYECRGQIEKLL